MEAKSGIHIKPSKRGTFTAEAKKHGKGVQEFASDVLSHKGKYSPAMRKKANFARNAAKWHKGQDGMLLPPKQNFGPMDMMDVDPQHVMTITPENLQSFKDVYPDLYRRMNPGVNWGNIAKGTLIGLSLADAMIPEGKIKKPVVQPLQSYNPYQYGTGSQAIYEDGGNIKVSKTGYKKNSKDKGEPILQIPSNQITMKDVPFPVLGVDNAGNGRVMMPGNDYEFEGDYVNEIPIKGYKGGMHLKQGGQIEPSYAHSLYNYAKNGKCMNCGGSMQPGGMLPGATGTMYGRFANPVKNSKFTNAEDGMQLEHELPYYPMRNLFFYKGGKAQPPKSEELVPNEYFKFHQHMPVEKAYLGLEPIPKTYNPPQNTFDVDVHQWGGVIPNMFHDNYEKTQKMGMFGGGAISSYDEYGGNIKAVDGTMLGYKNNDDMKWRPSSAFKYANGGAVESYDVDQDMIPLDEKAKSGNWIQGAVNPKHKGYCTPMTKSTCTGRRRAFAMTMKKHHGFHKKADGGDIQPYFEEGKTYNLSDNDVKQLVAAGYTIKMM